MRRVALFFVLLQAVAASAPDYVIDLADPARSMQDIIAVQVCAGLYNRDASKSSVYTLYNQPYDSEWLADIEHISNPTLTSTEEFLNICLKDAKVR